MYVTHYGFILLEYLFKSQGGIEKDRRESRGAVADIVTVALSLAVSDAFGELRDGVDKGASDTGSENDVLFIVLVVTESTELGDQVGEIAVSEGNVASLGETNVGDAELGGLSGIVDPNVLNNVETIASGLSKTRSALLAGEGGETIDTSK